MDDRNPLSVAQIAARVRAAIEDIGRITITGEVVQVSRLRNQAVRAVLVDRGDTRTVIEAHVPLDKGRWAKPDLTGGPATQNLVKVGQVLRLEGSPQHDASDPSWTFQVRRLNWVAARGPIECRRLADLAAWYPDAGAPAGGLTYASLADIAEVSLDPQKVKLLTAKWRDGHKDFAATLGKSRTFVLGAKHQNVIDVPVQGERMVDIICRRLGELTKEDADIIFIVRGGGGWSDLHDYDSPRLAEAIRACPVPVATAIGHAADRHLADHAADYAFTTPTSAAKWLDQVRTTAYFRREQEAEQAAAEARRRAIRSASIAGAQRGQESWKLSGPTALPVPHQSPPPPPSPAVPSYLADHRVPPLRPVRSVGMDWVSIVGVLLAITCIAPVALILGIVGIYRTRGGQRRGRRAAVAATILGAILTISFPIAYWAVLTSGNNSDVEVRVGTCLTRSAGTWTQVTQSATPCSRRHRAQVLYKGKLAAPAARGVKQTSPEVFCRSRISQRAREAAARPGVNLRIVLQAAGRPRDGDGVMCLGSTDKARRGSLLE